MQARCALLRGPTKSTTRATRPNSTRTSKNGSELWDLVVTLFAHGATKAQSTLAFSNALCVVRRLGGGGWRVDVSATIPAHARATSPLNPDSHLLEQPSSPAVVDPPSEHHPLTALAKDVAPVDSQSYRTAASEIKSTASPPGERQRVHVGRIIYV